MVEEDLLVKSEKLAERLEQANARQEELLKQMQEVESRRILGGKTSAGEPPKEAVIETPQDYAKRILRGGV